MDNPGIYVSPTSQINTKMKKSLLILLCFIVGCCDGYSYQPLKILPTKAIKQAIDATKKYGTTSHEPKMAWEVVEKIEYTSKKFKEC